MRLPGYYHTKGEPVMAEVIEANPDCRYTQQELIDCLESLGIKVELKTPKQASGISKNRIYVPQGHSPELKSAEQLALLLENCDAIRHCIEDPESTTEPMWWALSVILKEFEGGKEEFHRISALDKLRYSFAETEAKWAQAEARDYHSPSCVKMQE